ncbi:MAG: hypothetical protein K6T37_04275 [Acidothermus cellulolyticus]|nr:hypothetical protein [Acidothermus cellulolyticus]
MRRAEAAMLIVMGDFADPASYLASSWVDRLLARGREVEWWAVVADRSRPLTPTPVDDALLREGRSFAGADDEWPAEPVRIPNSGPATAAYAEACGDGLAHPMRRALFLAGWRDQRDIADPNVLRRIAYDVYRKHPAPFTGRPRSVVGDAEVRMASRRQGFLVSMAGGPLTRDGHERIRRWREAWQDVGSPSLPAILSADGLVSGWEAVRFLADVDAGEAGESWLEAESDRAYEREMMRSAAG